MTEDEIKGECRLYAVEWLSSLMFAMLFAQMGEQGAGMLEAARRQALEGARKKAFSNLDPAMSDLLSAELESAVDRILGMAREFLAKHRSSTG